MEIKITEPDEVQKFKLSSMNPVKQEGGIRIQKGQKQSLSDKPLISIITVVYNGEQFLEKTINSVINQSYENIEYIIVDGGSTDGTLDIIRKYEYLIDYWISEKDQGIYDAMNKGIDLISGEWINFMNAGDKFFNKDVVHNIFSKKSYDEYHFIFGDTSVNYGNFSKQVNANSNLKDFYRGMPFCHQSVFVQTMYHRKNKFNTDYKIAADFNLAYQAFLRGCRFLYIRNVISEIITGGVSFNMRKTTYNEYRDIVLRQQHTFKHILYYKYIMANTEVKMVLKKVLPDSVILYLQKSIK